MEQIDILDETIWKPIVDYEGLYVVNRCGDVYSIPRKIWNGKYQDITVNGELWLEIIERLEKQDRYDEVVELKKKLRAHYAEQKVLKDRILF